MNKACRELMKGSPSGVFNLSLQAMWNRCTGTRVHANPMQAVKLKLRGKLVTNFCDISEKNNADTYVQNLHELPYNI